MAAYPNARLANATPTATYVKFSAHTTPIVPE